MMEALDLAKHHRVLEVGTGSGYTTAILAQLADEVISLERFQSLAAEARARLGQMGIDNAGVVWGDGLAVPPEIGPFDRIFVEGRLDEGPDHFTALLADGGILVFARRDPEAPAQQQLLKLVRHGTESDVTFVSACRMQAILPGLSQAL
jgi:protein-L-isoaspartate(D-aspartate) O-methyltransferase